jgi:hypothetical protein
MVMRLLLYSAALWQRLEGAPWYSKAAGLVAAAATAVLGVFVTGALLLAAGASLIDWYYGRAAAMKADDDRRLLLGRELALHERTFSREVSMRGWQVKAGALLVVLLVRGLEYWLSGAPEPFGINTGGAAAAAIAVGIVADELDSIDENLRALGGRGIPLLSPVIAWLRNTASRFSPRVETAAKGH